MLCQYLRFPGGKAKAVTLSYDDGCPQDLRFVKLLDKYGLKCTFNHNDDGIHSRHDFTKEEIYEHFLNNGHEIAVHGSHHRAEGILRPIEGIRDVLDNRLHLENKLGRIIRGMAYPNSGITYFTNGANYESVKQYLTELDIAYARSLNGDNNSFKLPEDWHNWVPTCHHNNGNLMDWIEKFVNFDVEAEWASKRQPRLFYIWGHTYEFDNNDNWDLVDKIGEALGGKDDIWYASNIEICDYVKAYLSLVYSANGRLIYNPTATNIWLHIDGKVFEIKSGETLDTKTLDNVFTY